VEDRREIRVHVLGDPPQRRFDLAVDLVGRDVHQAGCDLGEDDLELIRLCDRILVHEGLPTRGQSHTGIAA
jgi:hypothetical protein